MLTQTPLHSHLVFPRPTPNPRPLRTQTSNLQLSPPPTQSITKHHLWSPPLPDTSTTAIREWAQGTTNWHMNHPQQQTKQTLLCSTHVTGLLLDRPKGRTQNEGRFPDPKQTPKRCPPTVGGHLLGGLFGVRKMAPVLVPFFGPSFSNFSVILPSCNNKSVLARTSDTIERNFFPLGRSDTNPLLLVQIRHYNLSHFFWKVHLLGNFDVGAISAALKGIPQEASLWPA